MAHIAQSARVDSIRRIENYLNDRRLTLPEILAETGADWAVNGLMWSGGQVCTHLKAAGRVLCGPAYRVRGLCWNEGPDIHMARLPNLPGGDPDLPEQNFLGGVALIIDGKPVEKPIYDPAQGGRRGRTAYGTKAGRFCVYCSRDGSRDARTPEQLRDLLVSYGWESAVMGDCGGSSQAILGSRRIDSRRVVKHVLLVYLRKKTDPEQGRTPCIRAYSREKDGETRLTEHFTVREFACRDGSDPIFIAEELPRLLEALRACFQAPVRITSGYRTPGHNGKVGGKPRSQHLYGCAADIVIPGVAPARVAAQARRLLPDRGGVGVYPGFTHIDVRPRRADWKG